MKNDNRKLAIIGTGNVGMQSAFAVLNQQLCDELVLLDRDEKKAEGEAADLNHSLAFAGRNMRIYAGTYRDCADADAVLLAAGVSQKQGEDRPALLKNNTTVFRNVLKQLAATGFSGILLVATNPVDIMTRIAWDLSGYPARRVLGTGTTLDTARLRFLLGRYFEVDPKNVHAYVIGEHGKSELIPWSQAMLATKAIFSICDGHKKYRAEELKKIGEEVKFAADKIIAAKGNTSYGIGMAAARILKAIWGDENSVLTVSAMLEGEYGERGVWAGVPAIVGRDGVRSIIELNLTIEEMGYFSNSCTFLREMYNEIG